MPRLVGTVRGSEGAVAGAYVQVQNLVGDFQGEVRGDAEGRFVLYPSPGRWRLVSWSPEGGRAEEEIEVGSDELQVELSLS